MQGTLVLAILNVKSSYLREVEELVSGPLDVPDTVQWWIAADAAWRIKTFALDHDIHTHSIGVPKADLIRVAEDNTAKHYGDVINVRHLLHFVDVTNADEVAGVLRSADLAPRLEVAPGRFAFWKPDDAEYHTQSEPKKRAVEQ
jgi:hypothetical protein